MGYLAYPYGERTFWSALQQPVQAHGLCWHRSTLRCRWPRQRLYAFTTLPASGFYADLDTLATKLASLPFHIDTLTYDDTVTTKRQPELTIFVPCHQNQRLTEVWFVKAELNWLSAKQVKITANKSWEMGVLVTTALRLSQQAAALLLVFSPRSLSFAHCPPLRRLS